MKTVTVAKFGGSLLDVEGKKIPKILKRICELKSEGSVGPIIVFSAPTGCTDELIRIGESFSRSTPVSLDSVFNIYTNIATLYVSNELLAHALDDLEKCKKSTLKALESVNKRFSGHIKAKILGIRRRIRNLNHNGLRNEKQRN